MNEIPGPFAPVGKLGEIAGLRLRARGGVGGGFGSKWREENKSVWGGRWWRRRGGWGRGPAGAGVAVGRVRASWGQQFAIVENFTTCTVAQSGFIPPDTMGAVGPNH